MTGPLHGDHDARLAHAGRCGGRDAGLDFGAGAGDVSLIASELVGPSGEVVAVDRSFDVLGRLQMRVTARDVNNVRVITAASKIRLFWPKIDLAKMRRIATEEQICIETLSGRLRVEAVSTGSQFIPFLGLVI